ncbi:LysR family transcriptional regulator [Aeromonas veronii]|uniref:LysR family transcriptional regulator n=1 Tax=Aeromonas veronii TaxID=654 RepID=UPI0032EE1EB4
MDRLGAMEVFVLAVETGSFSAVARRLGLGQPAVSKQIAQLEARLGSPLLLRSTRGLTPTEAGEAYYLNAKRILVEVEEAEAQVGQCRTGLTGRLRISAPVTFARLHLIPHLPAFMAAHPELELEILLDDDNLDLIAAGIDVALRLGPQPDSALVARHLAHCARVVVGTPACLAAAGRPQSPGDLQGQALVIYSPRPGLGHSWSFSRGDERVDIAARGRIMVSAAEGMRAAVLAGIGLGISSEWMFAPELASGEVVRLLPEWQLPRLDLWALLPAGRGPSAKASAWLAFVSGLPGLQAARTHSPAE